MELLIRETRFKVFGCVFFLLNLALYTITFKAHNVFQDSIDRFIVCLTLSALNCTLFT